MKVKVISEDFKSLAKGVLPFSGGHMATAGVVGLSFTETHVIIRAFAGTWAWGEVECHVEDYHEDIHLVVSDRGLEVALLYCDGENIIFDVSSDRFVAGSATIKTLASRTVEDLTPGIDLLDVDCWNILPDQAKRVIRVSLTDTQNAHGSLTNLHLAPDVIFVIAKAGSHLSAFIPDWGLDQTVVVPHDVAATVARKSGEITFCVLGDIVVFAIDNLHIATPQVGGVEGKTPEEVYVKCDSSKLGAVSSDLIRELDVALLQAENPDIFLWTDGSSDLYYHSPGSESGSNNGKVWSDLDYAFKICVCPILMKRLIPVGDMWKMGTLSYKEDGHHILNVVEESGVYHHLMSKAHKDNHDELFEKIINKYSGGNDNDESK